MQDVEVVLLQSAQGILTQFSAGLQQRALTTLQREGVTVRLGVRVVAVTQDQVRCCTPSLPRFCFAQGGAAASHGAFSCRLAWRLCICLCR
jgi:hypothetical protein